MRRLGPKLAFDDGNASFRVRTTNVHDRGDQGGEFPACIGSGCNSSRSRHLRLATLHDEDGTPVVTWEFAPASPAPPPSAGSS